jgi:hypothetical protein
MLGLARACYDINCTADGEICQLNIGKSCKPIVHVTRTVLGRDAVISAALAVTALTFSVLFDLEESGCRCCWNQPESRPYGKRRGPQSRWT